MIPWVFHRDGQPIKYFRRAWLTACKAAGAPHRIPHDFRRTAVRNLERAGVPGPLAELTVTAPFNDLDAVRAIFRERGREVAAVIVEPVAGNMGVVPPAPGFNRLLARTCADHDALFISDEVMTGFRVTRGGHFALDGAVEGWKPDLLTFGKVMGGGFPAAAFGGREGRPHDSCYHARCDTLANVNRTALARVAGAVRNVLGRFARDVSRVRSS